MNQCEKIVEFINRYGSITPLEALDFCGCQRLASRIWDLKKAGYQIKKEDKKVRCRNGEFATVAAYSWIISEEQGGTNNG